MPDFHGQPFCKLQFILHDNPTSQIDLSQNALNLALDGCLWRIAEAGMLESLIGEVSSPALMGSAESCGNDNRAGWEGCLKAGRNGSREEAVGYVGITDGIV